MCNPFGVVEVVLRTNPGCATRPRAMLLDCVAVTRTMPTNPNGVQHHSPGSRSAHWENRQPSRANPIGVQHGDMCNPFGVGAVVLRTNPGCATQPRAMLLDCVAVTRTMHANPNGVQHHSPGSRSAPWENRQPSRANPIGVQHGDISHGRDKPPSIPHVPFVDLETILFTQPSKLVLERNFPMMLLLSLDVRRQSGNMTGAD